jgi:uncharacterized membrane protein
LKKILPDKLLLLIIAIVISSFLIGLVILLHRLSVGEWVGFIFGTVVYLVATYYLAYRRMPRENKPHGFQLIMLSLAAALVIVSAFGLFYLKIIPLEGPGASLFYTIGALGLAIATDYFVEALFHRTK